MYGEGESNEPGIKQKIYFSSPLGVFNNIFSKDVNCVWT